MARASISGSVIAVKRGCAAVYLLVDARTGRVSVVVADLCVPPGLSVGDLVEFTGTLREGDKPLQLHLHSASGDTAQRISRSMLRPVGWLQDSQGRVRAWISRFTPNPPA